MKRDHAEAVRWYRKAAEQGQADAQHNLGAMHGNGKGVKQSPAEAARLYRKAAEQGHAGTQYNLGVAYANGRGVEQDHTTAVRWYRKAAEQGDADAQQNLGVMYENGEAVKRDHAEAVLWFQKAAEPRPCSGSRRPPIKGQLVVQSPHSSSCLWVLSRVTQCPRQKLQRLGACAATLESAREAGVLPSCPAHGIRPLCTAGGRARSSTGRWGVTRRLIKPGGYVLKGGLWYVRRIPLQRSSTKL